MTLAFSEFFCLLEVGILNPVHQTPARYTRSALYGDIFWLLYINTYCSAAACSPEDAVRSHA